MGKLENTVNDIDIFCSCCGKKNSCKSNFCFNCGSNLDIKNKVI